MRTALLTAAIPIALAGCANVANPQMSYLGFAPTQVADTPEDAASSEPPDAIRHVDSNRVLGAMAFQKVTRAKVDPQGLVKSRR